METNRFVLEVDNFLTPEECKAYIDFAETSGFEEALIRTRDAGEVMNKDIRDNDRVIAEEQSWVDKFYPLVEKHLPKEIIGKDGDTWRPLSLNERFRFYRYQGGQQFKVHADGHFKRNDNEVSMITMLIYLNDDFEGGETEFVMPWKLIKPMTGKLLLFRHNQLHKGNAVPKGVKYVLRTDVMYKKD